MVQLTKEQIREYIDHGGNKCPFCGTWDMSVSEGFFEGGNAWQDVVCNSCGAIWVDVYSLVTIEEKTFEGSSAPVDNDYHS